MKKFFILLLLIVFNAEAGYYYARSLDSETTYIHNLLLDDNAANTTVSNDGTGSDWTAGHNTSTYHSTTTCDSDDTFYLNTNNYYAYSAENWTSEKFEMQFWVRFDSNSTGTFKLIAQIGDGGSGIDLNSFHIRVPSANPDEIELGIEGETAEALNRSTDFAFSGATCYKIKVELDASQSSCPVTVSHSTNGTDWTELTMAGWSTTPGACTFNNPVYIGSNTIYELDGRMNNFTMEDTE